MLTLRFLKAFSVVCISCALFVGSTAESCSRLMYTTSEGNVVVGRSMDWMEDIKTDLWAFPAGMSRKGSDNTNTVKWVSKYGSVIASGYNLGSTDGINTQGLNANLLYLANADYGKLSAGQSSLAVLNWAQFVLDNYASVDEAVKEFGKNKFHMEATLLPDGTYPGIHLSISDSTGDNAIFEYVDGELVVYHNKKYIVMTNEPTFDKQLVLNDYWQGLKGSFLPGTAEPSDRFVRASYYLNEAPLSANEQQSIAIVFSIIRNVSQPITKSNSDRPNQAPTIWRSVADLKRRVYYFEDTHKANVFWVNLAELDLKVGASAKKLPLSKGEVYAGEVSSHFIPSKPF
ncbi:MAG: linear amide C-N hydrolase [Chlamydiales bacterium]|nr:linear amide C-N hydrolase [Chlamydiales bacterium]